MTEDIALFKTFGEALAIGLLIGVERYKSRRPHEKKSAGVRTLPVIALLGAACALLEVPAFTVMTFAGLLVLLGLGYYRESEESLVAELGKGRARRGMLEGDLDDGELEIGQVSGLIDDIPTVAVVMDRLLAGYDEAVTRLHPRTENP